MRQPILLHVKLIATLIFKHSHIMLKIRVKTVAAGILKIPDSLTNEERTIKPCLDMSVFILSLNFLKN